jgi:uncharacterized Zn finger protein
MIPTVHCPKCQDEASLKDVLTAQSNQNVIYQCKNCGFIVKNIETSKG